MEYLVSWSSFMYGKSFYVTVDGWVVDSLSDWCVFGSRSEAVSVASSFRPAGGLPGDTVKVYPFVDSNDALADHAVASFEIDAYEEVSSND